MRRRGFTLIELLVVMAILATLITIVVPRYFNHVDRAKETALKQSLNVIREAIDKFHGDHGHYPQDLEELVVKRYLRKLPVDPLTDSDTSWLIQPAPNAEGIASAYDVHSGAPGNAADGTAYAEW